MLYHSEITYQSLQIKIKAEGEEEKAQEDKTNV